ncbi:hypothetical protein [Ascidiimonas sp. W6]|uniref:hypothetical protein n=1 Tax=Ascidiimonas meishanensis TaxID=3128903 RepID=UPI0030EC6221
MVAMERINERIEGAQENYLGRSLDLSSLGLTMQDLEKLIPIIQKELPAKSNKPKPPKL